MLGLALTTLSQLSVYLYDLKPLAAHMLIDRTSAARKRAMQPEANHLQLSCCNIAPSQLVMSKLKKSI